MEVGVDGDHVDLAEDRVVVGVHLRPAEPGQPAVALVQQEAGGVEPRLRLARPRASSRSQPPCSGCRAKARLLTASHASSSCPATNGRVDQVDGARRSAAAGASGRAPGPGVSPTARGQLVVGGRSARTPTSGRGRRPRLGHDADGRAEQLGGRSWPARRGGAGRRRARALHDVVAPRHLGVARPGGRAPAPRRQAGEARAATVDRGRASGGRRAAGGRRRAAAASQQTRYTAAMSVGVIVPLDLEAAHGREATGAPPDPA